MFLQVKWVRMLYTNFSDFSRDQERLISLREDEATSPNYLEGLLLMHESQLDDFYSATNRTRIIPLITEKGLVYSIELVKYYYDQTLDSVDEVNFHVS